MQELKRKLEEFSSENVNLHLIIRDEKTKEYIILTTELNESIREDLLNNTKGMLNYFLSIDYEIENYSPVIRHDSNTIEIKDLNDIPIYQNIITNIDGDLGSYKRTSLGKKDRLWAFIVVIGNKEITMFQRCQPRKLLEPEKMLMIKELDNGRFSDFKDTLLTLDMNMDCIAYNDKMYIFKKTPFEEIFGVIDELKENVTSKLSSAPINSDLVNVDQLFELCMRDKRKIKRLSKVLDEDGFDFLTIDNINEANGTYDLGLELKEDGKVKLSPKNAYKLLKLMDRDCVDSAFSEEHFIANSKKPVN